MHASCGSFDVENSMHSSRAAFSSLHTQQGLGFDVAPSIVLVGLFEAARLLMERESEAVRWVLVLRWVCGFRAMGWEERRRTG
jgi:hypothetical protein